VQKKENRIRNHHHTVKRKPGATPEVSKKHGGLFSAIGGSVLAIMVTAIGVFLGAFLFSSNILYGTDGQFQVVAVIIQILSLLIAGVWVYSKNRGRNRLWILGMVGLYYLINWAIQCIAGMA